MKGYKTFGKPKVTLFLVLLILFSANLPALNYISIEFLRSLFPQHIFPNYVSVFLSHLVNKS